MRSVKFLAGVVAAWAMGTGWPALAADIAAGPPPAAPLAGHVTTLLTSGDVLVLGGERNGGPAAATERYAPGTNTWQPTAPLLQARSHTSATLLLSGRVLVAGGAGSGGAVLAASELYDAAANTWTPAAAMGVARQQHTATRLPSGDVLVFGGVDAGGQALGGERYLPASNTWAPQATVAPRVGHTATLLSDGTVLVLGGAASSGSAVALSSAELLAPAGGATAAAAMSTPRRHHTATVLVDGRVLVVGGESGTDTPLASAEIYDPASGNWSPTGWLPEARQRHGANLLPDGRVVLTGGSTTGGASRGIALVFDPVTNVWTPYAAPGRARHDHSATWLPNGSLLLVGGRDGVALQNHVDVLSRFDTERVDAADSPGIQGNVSFSAPLPSGRVLVLADGSTTSRIYDPSNGTWSATGPMSATRSLPTLTTLPSGQVLAAGGSSLATAEIYDETSNTWRPAASMSEVRRAHRAVLLRNGEVLVISGFNTTGEVPGVERYDPATDTWQPAAPLLVPRHYSSATLLADGRVLVAGGFTAGGVTTHSELYDPVANTWTATGALAGPRNGHMANLLHSGKVLVSGGSDSARNTQAQAEVYDPATGLWTPAGTLATGRENHTATLLPSGRVLVAGGYSSNPSLTFYAQTEVYDPIGNRWLPATSLATARGQHAAGILPDGRVLLTAGVNRTGFVSAAEMFDEGLAPDPARRPLLTSSNGFLLPSSALVATGSGFLPTLDASGGAANAAPTNAPVFQVERLDNGQTIFVPKDVASALEDGAFTGAAGELSRLGRGPVAVRAWVNGVPSNARMTTSAVPPGATADRTASGGVLQAQLGWSQPYGGGAPVTYTFVASNSAVRSCTTPCNALTFPLPPGDYTFAMSIGNAAGAGPGAAFGPVTVVKDAVAMTVSPATATPTVLASLTVEVTVDAATSDAFVPSGAVLVADGNGASCTIAALVDGAGTCELVLSTPGAVTLTASYAGDGNFETGSGTAAVTVVAPTIALLPATLPDGQVAQPYPASTFTASGGTAPYTYAIDGGALPDGLQLSSDGVVSGTPRASGAFALDIEATDANGFTGTLSVTLDIAAPTLALAPATLPACAAGSPCSATFATSGGIAPYAYTQVAGALPIGLALTPQGVLAGTPTQSGNFALRVRSTDSSGGDGPAWVERDYVLVVSTPDIVLTPSSLPDTQVGVPYAATQLTAGGGVAPYTFALADGSLPDGLALASDGMLSGTARGAGPALFTIAATDANGFVGTREYTLQVAVAQSSIAVTSSRNPSTPGAAVSFTITVTQGGAATKLQHAAMAKVATGNVTISEGATPLATVVLDGTGRATYTTDALSPGAHVLTLRYDGDANTAASSTQIAQQVVEPGVAPMPQTIPASGGWSLWLLLSAIGVLGVFATRRRG